MSHGTAATHAATDVRLRRRRLALGLAAFWLGGLAAAPAVALALEPSKPVPLPPGLPGAGQTGLRGAPEVSPAASAGRLAAQSSGNLVGTFKITGGSCSSGAPTGTYFQMIQPSGSTSGPFVSNTDSSCADKAVTPMPPGSDGGLSTTGVQPNPDPPFDGTGNALASRIAQPVKFFGVNFAVSTNATDPQTGKAVPVPSVSNAGGKLSGDLRAFSAAWSAQHFNQGSPKPDGSRPGLTAGPTGTLDAATGAYTLDWTTTIVGGAFNNFTGKWHLAGTFTAASGSSAPPASAAAPPASPATAGPATASPAAATSAAGSSPATSASGLAGTGLTWPALPLGLAFAAAGTCALIISNRSRPSRGRRSS